MTKKPLFWQRLFLFQRLMQLYDRRDDCAEDNEENHQTRYQIRQRGPFRRLRTAGPFGENGEHQIADHARKTAVNELRYSAEIRRQRKGGGQRETNDGKQVEESAAPAVHLPPVGEIFFGDQFVNRRSRQRRQLFQIFNIGVACVRLPFGNGRAGDKTCLRKFFLRPSAFGAEAPALFTEFHAIRSLLFLPV